MWKLSIEDDEGNRTVVSLVRDEYSIGRDEQNTVRLTERNVSRVHARLRRKGDGWLLDDAASYNGSFVNGSRVSTGHALKHGDLVQLGDYKLVVLDESEVADSGRVEGGAAAPVGPPNTSPLDQPDRLVMLVGPAPGIEFPLTSARILLGRGEDCDIALNHSSVSRVHAEVQALQDGRYEIIDRGSANGVRVNGTELRRTLLDARDSIELGDVVLKFIPAGDTYRFESDGARRLDPLSPASTRGQNSSLAPTSQRHVLSLSAKVGCGLSAVAVAGVVVAMAFGLHKRFLAAPVPTPSPEAPISSSRLDRATVTLREAVALLRNGQPDQAHAKVATLPTGSNARRSEDFRRIESAWADMMLARAAAEDEPEKAREIFNLVARSATVDSTRRQKAADEIAKLDASALDVAELPRSTEPDLELQAGMEPAASAPARGSRSSSTTKSPNAPATPAISSSTARTESSTAPRTRKMVASGNLSQLTAAKNALKAKVSTGIATPQEKKLLRALCRQLGDGSCVE